jgi:hypothetical protein
MEAYALLALGGLGLYAARQQMNKQKSIQEEQDVLRVNATNRRAAPAVPGNVPSATTVHDSSFLTEAARQEQRRAAEMARLAALPLEQSGVMNRHCKRLTSVPLSSEKRTIKSQLAGVEIPVEHFTHNNMTPFLRGDLHQNTDPRATGAILENLSGSSTGTDFRRPKQEREPLFDVQANQRTFDSHTDAWQQRMVVGRVRNHEFPIEQQRVGPGIARGFTGAPSDGYYDQRAFAMPRDTDEIRAADRPKLTFEGRVLPAQAAQRPADAALIGKVDKNRPDTFRTLGPEDMQPTTGAFLREAGRPAVIDRAQARESTTKPYAGGAFVPGRRETGRPGVQAPKTNELPTIPAGPVLAAQQGRGTADDRGRGSIQVYANARDSTTVNVHQGGVTSLIKSITAPLLDVLKPNRGACPHIVQHPREDGHLKGPSRIRIYDPDDVARTTLREGLTEAPGPHVLKGPTRLPVHDDADVARTTVRELLLQEAEAINLHPGGPSRITVKDPDDVTRTTLKEMLLQEGDGGTVATLTKRRGLVYDPDEVKPKPTHRQTLDPEDVGGPRGLDKPRVWDPEDVAKRTIHEMLVDAERPAGNPDGRQRAGQGYLTTLEGTDAKPTQRITTHNEDYLPQGARDRGQGHLTAPKDIRPSAKGDLAAAGEYMGVAAEQGPGKPVSLEEYLNARVNELRELILQQRDPVQTGTKVAAGQENIGSGEGRRQQNEEPMVVFADGQDRLDPALTPEIQTGQITQERLANDYDPEITERRLDAEVEANASQLAGNPFALRLDRQG